MGRTRTAHNPTRDIRLVEPDGAPCVVSLDGRGHEPTNVGGKGASLDRLVGFQLRVPPAIALTTQAYREFVAAAPALHDFLTRLAERPPPPPAQAGAEQRDVDDAFVSTPVPAGIREQLARHLTPLLEGGARVAVRSSATSEDAAETSFAGQHLTVLDVAGFDTVLDAVRRVWASLWHPAPRAYRQRMGAASPDPGMAVVIQRMVLADRSGVCFTVDPTRDDTLRVEVVDGLGESLVSGAATPEVWQLGRSGLRPIDSRPPDQTIRDVARASLVIEELFGDHPQDVEWSVADDTLWILQARPITAGSAAADGDGFDPPTVPGHVYAPAGVTEMLPGVLEPLAWTVNAPMIEDGFRRLYARLGTLPANAPRHPFTTLTRIRGRAALDLTTIKEAAVQMAGGEGAEVERQYLGRVMSHDPEPDVSRPGRGHRIAAAARALRLPRRVRHEGEVFERSAALVVDVTLDVHGLRSSELLAYRARIRDLAATGVAAEVATAAAGVAAYRALEVALERWVGDEAPGWAQRLTRNAAHGTLTAATAVWDATAVVRDPARLAAIVGSTEPDALFGSLREAGDDGLRVAERLEPTLHRLGSAALYGGRTWLEEPAYVQAILAQSLEARAALTPSVVAGRPEDERTEPLAELEAGLTGTWRWRLVRILTGQVVDVRRRVLRQLVANARDLLSRRESLKGSILALGGVERRVTTTLAERLHHRGLLDDPDDTTLLADWELEDLVLYGRTVPAVELDRRRERLAAYRVDDPLPTLVDHRGEPVAGSVPRRDTDANVVDGWGASPGRHRARARVVHDLSDADIAPGDIIVATATNPSWTPLFLLAGAVVVERGGPLSHAAIVARELGIPAVLNAEGATARIADGAEIEVDGDAGRVVIVSDRGPAGAFDSTTEEVGA